MIFIQKFMFLEIIYYEQQISDKFCQHDKGNEQILIKSFFFIFSGRLFPFVIIKIHFG